ncbi:MAG: ComEA family DNA-binding protein [Paludibacter sp.]
MWKDYFYFSKGQRVGIIVLIVLIVLVLITNYTLPLFFSEKTNTKNTFISEVEAFKKTLVLRDSMQQLERQRQYEDRFKNYQTYPQYKKDVAYTLFPFDPNTADSSSLCKLGIKPYIASNILKYRAKGGVFRTSADVGKVYGINPDKFKELEPYIRIQQKVPVKVDTVVIKTKQIKQDIIVDLNSADTTLLMQVRGIGRGYAKGIVRFRRETGGFVTVEQLMEVFGMRPDNYDKIKPFCTVNLNLVQKIVVNTATAEKLNIHPYLNFYQAKNIYELRRKRGKLHSINDLNGLDNFSSEDIAKIKPYLSFE